MDWSSLKAEDRQMLALAAIMGVLFLLWLFKLVKIRGEVIAIGGLLLTLVGLLTMQIPPSLPFQAAIAVGSICLVWSTVRELFERKRYE